MIWGVGLCVHLKETDTSLIRALSSNVHHRPSENFSDDELKKKETLSHSSVSREPRDEDLEPYIFDESKNSARTSSVCEAYCCVYNYT